ncbi:MAG TPA: diacylglycerol kinase family protein [Gemmatimonadales bacterium]|nr:diacylglycerol kinase family protein [Gemmatimonadales bacterium]
MTRALLISNPAAARTDARAIGAVRDVLQGGGWSVELAVTAAAGDARRLAERGRDEGFDAVLSYGGDGTAMQIAGAIAGTGIPLGLLPGGTGNVLAGNLRLPRQPVAAARAILRHRPIAIDLGAVSRADGVHYFAVCCGAGFDAMLMQRTDTASKRRWRRAAYVRAALTSLPDVASAPVRVTIDGTETRLDAAMVLVCNCADLMPPLLRIHADIRPDDGVLDVAVLRATGAWQSLTAFLELLFGGGPRQVWRGRGRTLQVTMDSGAMPAQLDGELIGTTPLAAQVLPGALRVLVDPRDLPRNLTRPAT